MGRLPRVYVEGAVYYVTCTADGGRNLFREDDDVSVYLELLRRYRREFGFSFYGASFEPDSIHLLLEPSSSHTISQIMHALSSNFTKYYNGRYETKGHLFRGRFKAVLIEKGPLLTEALRCLRHRTGYLPGDDMTATVDDAFMSDAASAERFAVRLRKSQCLGSDEFLQRLATAVQPQDRGCRNDQESAPAPRHYALAGFVLAVTAGIAVYLTVSGMQIRRQALISIDLREREFQAELVRETERLKQDLDEKYRADRVSYRALARRLEIEKQKTAEIQRRMRAESAETVIE